MREFQQIKRGRDDTITVIEHQTIENIARVRMFNDAFMDNRLFNLHQDLLRTAMNKNNNYEVGYFWNLSNLEEVYKIKGSVNGVTL